MSNSDVDQWATAGTAALQQTQSEQLRNSMQQAFPVNPDAEAQTRRNASAAQVPIDTARNMPDVVKTQAQMSAFDADAMTRQFPNTAKWLGVPDNAKIAHDDIPATQNVEQAVTALAVPPAPSPVMGAIKYLFSAGPDGGFMSDLAGTPMAAFKGLGGAFNAAATSVSTVAGALPVIADKIAGGTSASDWWFKNMVDPLKERASAFDLDPNSGFVQKAAKSSGQLLGLLSQITLTGGGGAPAEGAAALDSAATVVKGAVEHGIKAMAFPALSDAVNVGRKVYEETGDPGAAFKAASAQWMGTSAMGVVPLSAAGNLTTRLATGAVSGAASGELTRQGLNAALPEKMQTPFDWEETFLSGLTGSIMGGVMGPRGDVQSMAPGVRDTYREQFEAAKAEGQNEKLVELAKASAASKLRERDPEAFKQFVKSAADSGDLHGVYIDADKLTETLQQAGVTPDELRQTMPEVANQLDAALGTNAPRNGTVQIPIEDFATHIAGGPLEKPLMQHLRVDPEGGTVGESEAFQQSQVADLQARAQKIGAQHESDTAYQASLDKVNADLTDRLGKIGMKPDQAATNAAPLAAFYQVHADRLGILPHEFAERYPVNFDNKALRPGPRLDQPASTLDDVKAKWDEAGIKHAMSEKDGTIELGQIVVPEGKREQGTGRAAMRQLIDHADATGQRIVLTPSGDFGGNKSRLTKFYKSLGFVENKGSNKDFTTRERMIRESKDGTFKQDIPHIGDEHFGPAAALMEMGKHEGLFQYPKSKAKDPVKIASDKDPGLKVTPETITQMDGSETHTGNWDIAMPDGDGVAIMTRKGDNVYINVAGLKSGGRGALVYDLAANYAHNNGLKFVGDPAGVSKAAMIRRAENMLSSAVKYGTTDHLAPHPDQVKGNDTVPGIPWHDGNTLGNVRALMDATMGANSKLAPIADGIHYDVSDGHFKDSAGTVVDGTDVFKELSDWGRSSSGAGAPGQATLRRNALLHSLLQGEGARRAILEQLHRLGSDGGADAGRALDRSFYQDQVGQQARGTFSPSDKTISVLKGADLSTFQHELGHFFLDTLSHLAAQADAPPQVKADMATLLKWGGHTDLDSWHAMSLDEQRAMHEKFATGWETYLMKGEAPTLEMRSLFSRFRSWMVNVYKTWKNAPGEYSPEVKGVFDRMIASEDAIHEAELARKYMPLFDSPEKSGMSPEEWSAYQATGRDATERAIEGLIGKTMKDMVWMDKLRTASLKAVQKDAAEKRAIITREVKAEVMSQPVYRAWSFLTGKDTNGLPDEVNAEHQQAVRDWTEKRSEHETETKATARAKAWEAAPESKQTHKNNGLAKGQWLSKNRARIDLDIQREMLDWDQANPKPATPAKKGSTSADPTTGAGKLNIDSVKEAFGADAAKALQGLRMTGKKGMEPGIVADMFGFPDADTLVKALTQTEPPKSVVEGMTDQRMLERHGEIANPEAMSRTADELVQNEARSRFVATELRALKKATGKPKDIVNAAKEAAANTIDTKRVRDISARQYSAAETRSASQAEKAMAKGDTEGAAVAKRDQILNIELGRASRDAVEFVAKALDYLKKFDKPSVREAIDLEYRDQIDALLDRADLRKNVSGVALDKREALREFVERMSASGFKPQIPESLLNEAQTWHYKDMPLLAFRGLVDSVKSIEHLGKLKTKLRDLQETRDINDLADEVKATAAKLPQRAPESNRGLTRMQSAWVKSKAFGRSAQAAMLKMEQMFDWLDARNANGTLNRVVFRRLSEAGVHESNLLARVKGDIDAIVHSTLADVTKERGKVYVADGLIDGATGLPQKFTTKEMLMLAGNMGNESNAAKMAKGEKWDQQAVWDFLNKNMTKAHWDFVAGMGKTLESLWPEKLAMDRRLGNTSPEKIQPRGFQTPHGSYDGWYWPLMYDPARAQDVAERGARQGDAMFENIYAKADTDTGRMNTRNENYARPLLLDLDALPRMIKDEIHDVSHREAVIDADRFLSHPTVRKAIVDSLSQEHYDQLRPWLQSIANDGKTSTDGARGLEFFNTIAREARTRATIVGLGFRVTTALVHGMSAGAESVAELGPKWFGSGLKDFANPAQWAANKDFVFERSGEMRNRMNEVDRDVREHIRQIDTRLMDPTTGAVARGSDIMKAHAYSMIAGLDMASALPTWMGAYKKGMTAIADGGLGLGEKDAVYFADKTVRNAHGGTGIKDMARIQRGSEFQKLFTMFYTFWNHNINRIIDTSKLVTSPEHRAAMKEANHWTTTQMASVVIMRTLVYTIGVQVLHSLVHPPKKEDDGESWAKWAAKELTASAFAGIPIARDLSAHFITGKDYSVTPAASMVDAIGKSGTDAANALTGKEANDKWLKHTLTTAGYVFSLPTGQVSGSAQFLWDVAHGDQHPQSAKDWWNGMLHGDTKQH